MAKILYADADLVVGSTYRQTLERAGHTVRSCRLVAEARAALREGGIEAVLCGWKFEDGIGREVILAAKEAGLPVAVISGAVGEAFQAPEPLADYYLEKPVSLPELVSLVGEMLGMTKAD